MISLVSLASLAAGGVLAYLADGSPRRKSLLKTYGGLLLIGGLALLGAALPH